MNLYKLPTPLIVLILLGMSHSVARADLPADRYAKYTMHETPSDPESDVVFSVELTLSASDSDGDSVGWDIEKIRFVQPVSGGQKVWIEDTPVVDSPDGLWWVEHADHDNPQVSEFSVPPLLTGTADAESETAPDLDYEFEGEGSAAPAAPETSPSSSRMTIFSWVFWIIGELQPEEEEEEEIAEMGGGVIDPI